eukprot:scaffold148_cov243-Pinguiococcus_pyrenoidosus.AAC.1
MHGRCTLRELVKLLERNDKSGVGALAEFTMDNDKKVDVHMICNALLVMVRRWLRAAAVA